MNDTKFEEYSDLFTQAFAIEKTNKDEALKIYEHILSNYVPTGTLYYERPAILYERDKRYDDALRVCNMALENLRKVNHHTYENSKEDFEKRINRLKVKNGEIPKSTSISKSVDRTDFNTITTVWNNALCVDDVQFPEWYVSVSFGISTSDSFSRALAMAQCAPIFIRQGTENNPVFQAVYSKAPQEFLAFIALYELVKNWKSSTAMINGRIIDRKIIGNINYCYGDKCRSGNPDFCFGASVLTDNPFGCHRLQISADNHPWYSFGRMSPTTRKLWLIDKQAIRTHAESFADIYCLCPAFDWNIIQNTINDLPDSIDLTHNSEYVFTSDGLKKRTNVDSHTVALLGGNKDYSRETTSKPIESNIEAATNSDIEEKHFKNNPLVWILIGLISIIPIALFIFLLSIIL